MKLNEILEPGSRLIVRAIRYLSEVNCATEPVSFKNFKHAYSLHSNFVNDVILYHDEDDDGLTLRRIYNDRHTDFYVHDPRLVPISAVAATLSSHTFSKFTVTGNTALLRYTGDKGPAEFYISFVDEQIEWGFDYTTQSMGIVLSFEELLVAFNVAMDLLENIDDGE